MRESLLPVLANLLHRLVVETRLALRVLAHILDVAEAGGAKELVHALERDAFGFGDEEPDARDDDGGEGAVDLREETLAE